VTDNSNFIVDLYFQTPIVDSAAASAAILALEGVVDHGLFLGMVDVCIIAGSTGVEVRERK
jgi:ribose 5-phosphate isomerase A